MQPHGFHRLKDLYRPATERAELEGQQCRSAFLRISQTQAFQTTGGIHEFNPFLNPYLLVSNKFPDFH
jgi:hypothetical protein